jgi:ribosomal protein L29
MSKKENLSELSFEQLVEQLHQARKDQFENKVKHAARQLKDTSVLRKKRKQMARLLTEITAREEA